MTRQELDLIAQEVSDCRHCRRLVRWREEVATTKRASFQDWTYWGRGVPGFGDAEARVVVVGLAPAAHGANRTGRMFTGDRSGDWLYGAMHRAGFANQANATTRDDGLLLQGAYVTAVVRCAPPKNKPTPKERDTCIPYLERELAALPQAKVFVALGAFAYQALTPLLGVRPRPRFGHGVEVPTPAGPTILCSFHPSQRNTFTGKLTAEMFDAIFTRAAELSSP